MRPSVVALSPPASTRLRAVNVLRSPPLSVSIAKPSPSAEIPVTVALSTTAPPCEVMCPSIACISPWLSMMPVDGDR